MLEARAISKRFGITIALDRVDFHANAGEIHALVGENGAGKSTLINILAGRIAPDSGFATIDGTPLAAGSADRALDAGVAAVYQSPMMFERMSWEENLALGGFVAGGWRRELAEVADHARKLAAQLGFELPPAGAIVADRSIADRVRLEIIRALSFDPRVLILDEPTGVLAPTQLAPFLETLKRLRAAGRAVIIVTHKLAEALAVADRITVMRRGRVVAERAAAATGEAEIARLMLGELAPLAADFSKTSSAAAATGGCALELDRLTLDCEGRRVLDGVALALAPGEITGIAGVDGNGQSELVEVLAGVRETDAGTVRPGDSGAAIALIPQNRDLDGLILDMELWENLILPASLRAGCVRRGWLRRAQARSKCGELLERFRIRAPSGPASQAAALSGGNRQRLAVARALAANPRIIVAHDICHGLDLRAAAEVHQMLRDFVAAGGAVLLISSDLDELLALSSRLFVMCRGRIVEAGAADRDPARLGLMMCGVPAAP